MAVQSRPSQWSYVLSFLRIIIGLTFSCHGAQKILGLFGGMGGHGEKVHFASMLGLAGFLELIGGLLILVGLFTRPVALILCGEMAVAYFTAHAPRAFWPIVNKGELAVVYCFVFLYLFAAGAGPVSLDRLIRKRA